MPDAQEMAPSAGTATHGRAGAFSRAPDSAPLKVLFLEPKGLTRFLDPLVEQLERFPDLEVRHCRLGSLSDRLPLRWADVVWLEWANELAAAVTQRFPALRSKRVLVRLHRYETFTSMPSDIRWDVVDKLIFVSEHMEELFADRFPDVSVDTTVIHNGVDLDRFGLRTDADGEGDIAFAAHLNHRKNLPLLVQIAARLAAEDPERRIRVAGDWQHPVLRHYMEHVTANSRAGQVIRHEGWVDDMSDWLPESTYLLSTSMHESFGYSICEGMACGLKPVIHDFPGAREFYAGEFLFTTVDEAVRMLRARPRRAGVYRKYVARKFPRRRQIAAVRRTLGLPAQPHATEPESKETSAHE